MYEKESNLYKQLKFTFNAMPTSIIIWLIFKKIANFFFFNIPNMNISQFQQ
jgi:hypothetical protein